VRPLVAPRFTRASANQFKATFKEGGLLVLAASACYRTFRQRGGEKLLPEKAYERTKQATRKKIQAIKRQKQETLLPLEYRSGYISITFSYVRRFRLQLPFRKRLR